MSYHETLSQIIADSHLTLKEISARCEEHGESVALSYISKLRGNQQPPASDPVNEAIAKACNASDYWSDKLRYEAVLAKLPEHYLQVQEEVYEFIRTTLFVLTPGGLSLLNQSAFSPTGFDLIRDLRQLREMYGSEMAVLEFLGRTTHKATSARTYRARDDSMDPHIPEGSVVRVKETSNPNQEVVSGDFLALKGPESLVYFRRVHIVDNVWILTGERTDIPPVKLEDRSQVIGVVTQVTRNFFNPRV